MLLFALPVSVKKVSAVKLAKFKNGSMSRYFAFRMSEAYLQRNLDQLLEIKRKLEVRDFFG